jgi:GMP synthase (glutamine-hydrolysing)
MTPRVLLIHAGPTLPGLLSRFGDFDRWFTRALEPVPVGWTVVRPFLGEPLPAPRAFDAALMTGSLASVLDAAPWMLEAERWVRAAIEGGLPFLGVCFGHQLLCHAFGARVVRNPNGLELGTPAIALTDEGLRDPLLGALLSPSFRAHESHHDMATDLPPALRLLARNEWTPVQAVAAGERAWGVQFHPEMDEAILGAFAEALAQPATGIASMPEGPRLLRAFVERFGRG